ncbi:3-hydroxyacyl-CoA dehydratase 2 [Myotis davidii]|uniref:Very-long-chain (3R)-3-hydroxyacyl-CoA dehydratase n=1 Tax=Myotis davidii TaxID=225400 RepID=L5LCG4_MYODS|nr:3-hydroxyacyl-CoA dehydratase 2 [Myotis davidii]
MLESSITEASKPHVCFTLPGCQPPSWLAVNLHITLISQWDGYRSQEEIFQILHCAIGIVPSSVVLTSFQVMSRVFLIWAVTHSVKEVQSEDSVLLFVIAWTITEIIRYSFYTFSLLNHLPYLIKWARYTLFIVLYPMGVSGELLTIYAALPFVRQAGLYSISLPNKYNFSFDYYAFLILIMISYIPLFPQLYFHMIHQRRKVLSHTEEHKKFE